MWKAGCHYFYGTLRRFRFNPVQDAARPQDGFVVGVLDFGNVRSSRHWRATV